MSKPNTTPVDVTNDIMDSVMQIANSNKYDKATKSELDTPDKGKFEVSLEGNFTDEELLASGLAKGIKGAKLVELCSLINTQQDEGANVRPPVVISADAIYTPFAGKDRHGRQMSLTRNERYENDVEVNGNIEKQVVYRCWFTLTSTVPRKAVSIKNFVF